MTAFRAVGVPAELDADLEICVGDRKICGHGAGQVDDAVVVCGNLIERFDHERAARVLALAGPAHREQTLQLMRASSPPHRSTPPASRRPWSTPMPWPWAWRPVPGALSPDEARTVVELDAKFTSEAWLAGPSGPARRPVA